MVRNAKLIASLLAAAALGSCATGPSASGSRPVIAITIDDLPVHGEIPRDETHVGVVRGIIAALRNGDAMSAHGFSNNSWTERQPATLQVLEEWRAAGLPLANHGWAHRHLNEITLKEFEQEVARNEPLLQRLARGDEWRWFRFPFLDEGETPVKRAAARKILADHGYRVAAVTMDFSDWQWTAPYARCKDAGDEAAIGRLERSFLHAARETIGYYRGLSRAAYGRDIPYVLLLHISAFEARMLPRLLALYHEQGFRFVTLDEAQRDPVYREEMQPDLPPSPQGLENQATARGVRLPKRTDYAPMLEAICRAPAASSGR